MKKNRLLIFLTLLVVIISGCASKPGQNKWLPSSESVMSGWRNYSDVILNYRKIKSGMNENDLKKLDIYDGGATTKVLNWLSVYNLLPEDAVKRRKLDSGILNFIDAGDSRVKAFKVVVSFKRTYREGNFILDMLSFQKKIRTIGFEFCGLVLLVDGKVSYVFRPTGGPTDKFKEEKNPLGPLNDFDSDTAMRTTKNILL